MKGDGRCAAGVAEMNMHLAAPNLCDADHTLQPASPGSGPDPVEPLSPHPNPVQKKTRRSGFIERLDETARGGFGGRKSW
jgi:hypothetical protein